MRWGVRALAVAVMLVMVAAGLVARPMPVHAATAPGPVKITGVAYAPPQPAASLGHLLDLYLPRGIRHRVPLVIWSHGSAFAGENGRSDADVLAKVLVPRGYAVAGVAVRSSAFVKFPGQLYDIKAAIRFLRANSARYNLDPARFAIMGESSGGWVAVMAAVTGDVPALEGRIGVTGPSSRVEAAVPIYTPTDFLRMDSSYRQRCRPVARGFGSGDCHTDARSPESTLLGCPITTCTATVARADPDTYASRRDPPMLLLHGRRDTLVPWQQSQLLYQAARSACGDATLVLLPGGGHGQWHAFFADPTTRAGATVVSSRHCHDSRTRPVKLSWGYLVSFLDRSLRVHR